MKGDHPEVEALAALLVGYHHIILTGDDEEAKNAVIIKAVALTSLAFDLPAIEDEPVNTEEAITKLRWALKILAGKQTS